MNIPTVSVCQRQFLMSHFSRNSEILFANHCSRSRHSRSLQNQTDCSLYHSISNHG